MAEGEIVAAHGRNFVVESDAGELLHCVVRGKDTALCCGDRVAFSPSSAGEAVIEAVRDRSSLFLRAAVHRQKLIAANATQLALVVATDPSFSDELVMRAIAAAEHAGLGTLIILNKADLAEALPPARARLACFAAAAHAHGLAGFHDDLLALGLTFRFDAAATSHLHLLVFFLLVLNNLLRSLTFTQVLKLFLHHCL